MKVGRFSVPPALLAADSNIRFQYPIQRARWIVHPDIGPRETSFCRYMLDVTLDAQTTIDLHVSADNRFELRCDGEYIGMGPDRSDVEHWSFHSYRVSLAPGAHRFTADVHYLADESPCAQTSVEPGFLLYAEGGRGDLSTGVAPWKVVRLGGVTTSRAPVQGFFVVGPNYTIDAEAYFAPPEPVDAVVLREAGIDVGTGRILPGWKLHPSRLPEQVHRQVGGGRARYVGDLAADAPFPAEDDATTMDAGWQSLVEGRAPVTVPAGTRTVVLWDLEQYHTAYPEVIVTGGAEGRVAIEWAEACYMTIADGAGKDTHRKENRDEIVGKYFRGNGDTFLPDGPTRTFRSPWWRAGRYVRITVVTDYDPLTIDGLRLMETRMPLENDAALTCSDPDIGPIVDVAVRGIQMCAHETYMDCPYFEQMMYTGDTRLQMLVSYVMSAEDRLNQRGLELFDWSRRETGFVLERYPSDPKQLSTTFAMVWVLMLRDHAWWRNAPEFVKLRLKGMRCLLEEFKEHLGDADLLPPLPGWSFMDWVSGLSYVNPPGSGAGVASVVNLLFINALNAAAELEDAFGEPLLAEYNRGWARRMAAAVDATFWNKARGLFADDRTHTQYSEHAQCLALLSRLFPGRDARCFESLITADDLLRTTVYFSFYLLETFAKFDRGDLILRKLDFWKEMVRMGFKTPVEMPEPSRSDCHAWGSHPLFHLHASLAGIRPAAPGFASVRVEPRPGTLTELNSTIPHPAGEVSLRMKRQKAGWRVNVSLPAEVPGTLVWDGEEWEIAGTSERVLG